MENRNMSYPKAIKDKVNAKHSKTDTMISE